MSKQNRARTPAPAAEVQQPAELPKWMDPLRPLIEAMDGFVNKTVTRESLRATFAAARASDSGNAKGSIDRLLGESVVVYGFDPSIFVDALGEENKTGAYRTRLARAFVACAKEANFVPGTWSKKEAGKAIDAWKANHITTASGERPSLMARIARRSAFPYGELEQWVNKTRYEGTAGSGKGGDVSPQSLAEMNKARIEILAAEIAQLEAEETAAATAKEYVKAGELSAQIAKLREELASLTAKSTDAEEAEVEDPDDEPVVENRATVLAAEIAQLEAEETAAATAKYYTKAGELSNKVAELREELASLTAAASAPTPSSVEAAPMVEVKTTSDLDRAQTLCRAPGAGKGLRKAYERWDKDELSDEAFVAKVRDIVPSFTAANEASA